MALKYIVLSRGVERTDSQTDGRITAWLVDTLYLRWGIKIIRGLHGGPAWAPRTPLSSPVAD